MEQGCEVRGTDAHLPGDHGHAELDPNILPNVPLGVADDFVFVVDGIGCAQRRAGRALGLPQNGQQQLAQEADQHICRISVLLVPFPQHLLQQEHRFLGVRNFRFRRRSRLSPSRSKVMVI